MWAGTARLFLAELRGRQRRPLSAASQAGKARRQLEAAREADPSLADAGFGLGTQQLLASRLSTIAKGIGSLFGVSGKHEVGMALLEQAAREGRDLRFESRVFLIASLASRHERRYADALDHVAGLLAEFPDAVLALDAAARVETDLGRSGPAKRHVEAALARCEESAAGTDRVVSAGLRFLRARVEFFSFRQDLALEDLERVARAGVSLPEDLRKNVLQLARHAAALVPSPPSWPARLAHEWNDVAPRTVDFARAYSAEAESWSSAAAALELERRGPLSASAEALLALARSRPDDPVLSLLAGRALVLMGDGGSARPWLGAAAGSPRLPAPWRGICLLLEGQASDLAGDRASALASYRKASEVPGFREDEAAAFYQQVPFRNDP
jgi:tetratricopeptide (TPR) repeat protein